MKLWKENMLSQEWELDNNEIAKQFLNSDFYKDRYEKYGDTSRALVIFITDKSGLHSSWEWDEKKGSINGSKDMLNILDIIERGG